MKWFQHISKSGDDPDIGALITEFGLKGYYLFFRTLEIMSKEFDVHNPGKNEFDFKWFLDQFSRKICAKTVLNFLTFCANNLQKQRITYELKGVKILLNCPKLKELTDAYTEKLLRSKSEVTPDTNPEPLELEVEEEVEEDKEKKKALSPKISWLDKFLEYVKAETLPDTFKPSEKPYDAYVHFCRGYLKAYGQLPDITEGEGLRKMKILLKLNGELLPQKIDRFFEERYRITWADVKTLDVFRKEAQKIKVQQQPTTSAPRILCIRCKYHSFYGTGCTHPLEHTNEWSNMSREQCFEAKDE